MKVVENLYPVKNPEPNQGLIKHIEELLKEAKAGDLRAVISVCSYHNDESVYSWTLEESTCTAKMLGTLQLANVEFSVKVAMGDRHSVFVKSVEAIIGD